MPCHVWKSIKQRKYYLSWETKISFSSQEGVTAAWCRIKLLSWVTLESGLARNYLSVSNMSRHVFFPRFRALYSYKIRKFLWRLKIFYLWFSNVNFEDLYLFKYFSFTFLVIKIVSVQLIRFRSICLPKTFFFFECGWTDESLGEDFVISKQLRRVAKQTQQNRNDMSIVL